MVLPQQKAIGSEFLDLSGSSDSFQLVDYKEWKMHFLVVFALHHATYGQGKGKGVIIVHFYITWSFLAINVHWRPSREFYLHYPVKSIRRKSFRKEWLVKLFPVIIYS